MATGFRPKVKVKKQGLPEQRVLRFIRENSLVSANQTWVVAVSGGPDSVCLLHMLMKLKPELGIELHVAHLDHQLRGADSEADARYVGNLAQELGFAVTIGRRDVKAYEVGHHTSLEEAAREVRYDFLAEVVAQVGAVGVVLGHTLDDHVETILLHLIRGSGTRGLRGLQPDSPWPSPNNKLKLIRPLLWLTRDETAEYCRVHGIEPRIDATNQSLLPLRNRIRHELIPLLRSYNPGVTEALRRMACTAADDLAFLDNEARRVWAKVVRSQGDVVILDRAGFLILPPALQRHLLRMAIEELLGNLQDIETRHIEEIILALEKPAGKRLILPGGLVFTIEYERYVLGRDDKVLCPFPQLAGEVCLAVPGETRLPGWRIMATVIDRASMRDEGGVLIACLDLDKIGRELKVRPRRTGDRFQPLGLSETKKLGEFMIDARIPRTWRERVPIVCSPQQVLWVVGWRIDERVKVTDGTHRILRLEFERVADSDTEG